MQQQEEYQELRWMRLTLLKRKQAPDHMLLDGAREPRAFAQSSVS